jgi:hypothetical protein
MSTPQYADVFNTPTVEALEPIDIGLDEQELKGLAHTLQVLHQYMATFNDQRAVCQAQVRQLIDECDIALDDRYPVQSFTKAPSEQNLSAVTEGVLDRIGSGFVEYCKKIWEFVKKIISWIVAAFKRLFKREDQVIHHVAVIREVRNASRQIKSVSPRGASSAHSKEEQDKHAERALLAYHEAVEHYQGQMTRMGMDMLTQGHYVSAVKSLAMGAPIMVNMLQKKLVEIERRINTHNEGKENPSFENFQGLTDVMKAPTATIDNVMRWLGMANRVEEWADIVRFFLANAKSISEEAPSGSVMEWNIAAGVIVNPSSGLAEPMVPVSGAVEDYVRDMEPIVEKMRSHPITRSIDPKLAAGAEEALDSFLEDVRSMLQYMEIANITLDCQYHLVKAVAHCAEAEFDVDCAKHMTDEATRDAVSEIRKKLSIKISAIKAGT